MKLFSRKSKKSEPGAVPEVPVSDAQPVDDSNASGAVEATKQESAGGGPVQQAPSPLRVMFAPLWTADELIKVEEGWQDGTLVVRAELPGIDPDNDVRLTVVNGRLDIEAERHEQREVEHDGFLLREQHSGRFLRSLPLDAGVTAAAITAAYTDGLLEIHIPAAATPALPATRIPITTSSCERSER